MATDMDLELFRALFARVADAYGIETPGGPKAERQPPTAELLHNHVAGKIRVGIYTTDAEDRADQLVLDDDENRPDLVKRLLAILDELRIEAYPETSKSKGYHIRAHFQPAPAADLRKIGAYVARLAGVPDIEVFPKQDRRGDLDPKTGLPSLGNFVWLPLHGKSLETGRTAIVDRSNGLEPFPDQWEAVHSIQINSLETLANALAIVEEAEPTPKAEKESTRGRLSLDLIGSGFKRCEALGRYKWNATETGRLLPDDDPREHPARIAVGNYCRTFDGGKEWAVDAIFRHLDDYDPAKTRKQFASLKGLPPLCSGVGLCPEGQCDAIKSLGRKSPIAFAYEARRESRTHPVEPEAPKAKWPDPPDQAAYYGLAGDFVRLVEPHTEADSVALLAQFLVMAGNMIGRGPHAKVEADRHYTNLFAVPVGVTSHGRKGTSTGQVRRPLRAIDEHWEQNRIQGGLSSGEGLIWGVRDPIYKKEPIRVKKGGVVTGYQDVIVDEGVSDKRLMAFAPEFSAVLKVAGRDGSTLSETMRQAWDTGYLRILTKNNPAVATEAHISVIGHITKTELLRHLNATEKANGFGNRILWFCVQRSKQLPMGGKIDSVDFTPFLSRLRNVVDIARRGGERTLPWDAEATKYWCSIYGALSSGGTGMAAAVTSRAEAQVLRLSLVYAVLDGAESMSLPHLQAAKALWDYSAASVRYIFGDSLGDPIADEIMGELRKAGSAGRTRNQIRELFARNLASDEIARALELLREQGIAYRRIDASTGGRPAEKWFATSGGEDSEGE